jgi:hypothetical protein
VSGLYQNLTDRIRVEVSDLEQVIERAGQAWQLVQKESKEQYAYLDSVALNLHSFYSGLEKLFELIARHVDRSLPSGETWHRDLLQQMTQDLPDIRPAVISQDNAVIVDEFRRFRHLVRNVYTIDLVPEKMEGLMGALPNLWPPLRSELLAFADYLDTLNTSLQQTG